MSEPFSYLFRFCCDPGFNDKQEIGALMQFVDDARIDDVMVFANVEEINTGHMSFTEQDVYIKMMKEIKAKLEPKSITLSINQWHSLMHADLGKKLREGQDFRLMVDPYGNQSRLCVCPLCDNWRGYITELYARYAAIEPYMLWVEDDFRLHNHDPLVWGGCFCEEHMKLYSQQAIAYGLTNYPLTREEFVAGVLKAGEVHPYRKIWLDISRQAMVENAELIGKAVHAVSPNIRIGLMSSAPHIHAAEGRDWHGILKGLGGEMPPVNRIHLPGYVEPSPSGYMLNFNSVSMLTRAMVPTETEIYPELENFPYSRFTKSRKFTRFQLLSAMPLNLSGMTIDLYDLNGNGIVWEEGYQDTLRDTKDYLNRLTELGVFKQAGKGVHVMYDEKSSYTLYPKEGISMEELYPQEMFFSALLHAYGIPCVYSSDRHLKGQIIAISGQYLRNLSADEIKLLLQNNFVILEGTAAMTLYDMGLGELANIENALFRRQNDGSYAYEQVCNGKHYCGIDRPRASALLLCCDCLDVKYSEVSEEITMLCNSYRQKTMNGLTLAKENLLIYPFGDFQSFPVFPQMLLNNIRQALLQEIVALAGEQYDAPPFVVGEPYLNPYFYETLTGFALYLVNAATDDLSQIHIQVGNRKISHMQAVSSVDNETKEISFAPDEKRAGVIKLELPLKSMETVLLLWN